MNELKYIPVIAAISEKISSINNITDGNHLFATQFIALFKTGWCRIYSIHENDEFCSQVYDSVSRKKPVGTKMRSAIPFILDSKTYVFAGDIDASKSNQKLLTEDAKEIMLCVRRNGEVKLFFYGITALPIFPDALLNETARIFSNMYLQLDDALAIRNKITDKQQELSGHISESNDTLLQLNERLLQYNQELQQFAYSASHDLQEPLRTINSYIKLFLKNHSGTLTPEGRELLFYAANGAERMHVLIKDLLIYSKLDQQNDPMLSFNGNDMLSEALNNLRLAVEESNAMVLYTDLPKLYGNQTQLILLFQNLIDNAIKFKSKHEPVVWIDVEERQDQWEFRVRDNGIGIPQQFQNKIFGIFNRLHANDEIQGTGLGLSICKKIVERHKGYISVESKPGKGSTFTFSLKKV